MTSPSNIELIVMRRVRLIRILALVISTVALAVLAAVVTLWGIGREVWVAQVFQNMPDVTHKKSLIAFWVTAFTHTRLIVQVLVVLTLGSSLFLIREIARFVASVVTQKN